MTRRAELTAKATPGPLWALAVTVLVDRAVPVPFPITRIYLHPSAIADGLKPPAQGKAAPLAPKPLAGVEEPAEEPTAWMGHVPVYVDEALDQACATVLWADGAQQALVLTGDTW